jgi:hypothetical protein
MADAEPVIALARALPESITLPASVEAAALTPNEMRAVKTASGMRLDVLFGDETDSDDKTQAMVFVALRRAGYDPTWEQAGDVRPVPTEEPPDPTRPAP